MLWIDSTRILFVYPSPPQYELGRLMNVAWGAFQEEILLIGRIAAAISMRVEANSSAIPRFLEQSAHSIRSAARIAAQFASPPSVLCRSVARSIHGSFTTKAFRPPWPGVAHPIAAAAAVWACGEFPPPAAAAHPGGSPPQPHKQIWRMGPCVYIGKCKNMKMNVVCKTLSFNDLPLVT